MSAVGDRVIDALAEQGYGIVFHGDNVNLLTPDGRRVHNIPVRYFTGEHADDLAGLRIVVAGLEAVEGFTAPHGFWPTR